MSSMSEVASEGQEQFEAWLDEQADPFVRQLVGQFPAETRREVAARIASRFGWLVCEDPFDVDAAAAELGIEVQS